MEEWQKKGLYGAIGIASIMIIFLMSVSFSAPFLVQESCSIEAGRELSVDKVVRNPFVRLFSSISIQPDITRIGKQEAVVRVGAQNVITEVQVYDRIAPKVTLRELSVLQGNQCKIEEFVVAIEDATDVTMEYVKEPSFSTEGVQKVKIRVTDSAGNTTEAETQLIVIGI